MESILASAKVSPIKTIAYACKRITANYCLSFPPDRQRRSGHYEKKRRLYFYLLETTSFSIFPHDANHSILPDVDHCESTAAQPAPLHKPRNIQEAYKKAPVAGWPSGPILLAEQRPVTITVNGCAPDRTIRGLDRSPISKQPRHPAAPVIKLILYHQPGAVRYGCQVQPPDAGIYSSMHFPRTDDRNRRFVNCCTWHRSSRQTRAPHDSVQLSFDWHMKYHRKAIGKV